MAKGKQKTTWYETTAETDIAYRGPLSARHFKILGWLCVILAQVSLLLAAGMQLDPSTEGNFMLPYIVVSNIAPLSIPFLLFANFGTMLNTDDYKKPLLTYGIAALAVIGVFAFLYNRYILGMIAVFAGDIPTASYLADLAFSTFDSNGFLAFNLFMDLFLCTLTMFFLNYEPKKHFQGKKVYLFRALTVVPFAYEIASIAVKLYAASDALVPINVFPFLTAKPPMMFVVFTVFVLYLKLRERRYVAHGGTHEEYLTYEKTNRSSLQFAKFAALTALVVGLLDYLILVGATTSQLLDLDVAILESEAGQQAIEGAMGVFANAGFGQAFILVFFAPIMLLYSYTRTYENKAFDYVIPTVALVLIIVLFLEAALIAVQQIPLMFEAFLAEHPAFAEMLYDLVGIVAETTLGM